MSSRLEFTEVSKDFNTFRALDHVSFSLQPGEVVGILGHNGAGKTTSMKLALGILAPSQGQVRVMGEDPLGRNSEQRRRNMGYLPENVSFYQQLSGREVLKYFARLKGVSIDSIDGLLQQVGLTHAADRRVKTYSKGMRQRVGLAQALLGQPQLLLLDEPTAGLDPQATAEFYSLLDNLRAEGVSILISSHVLPGIERHVDRAIIMSAGKLRAQGSLDQLRAQAELPLIIRAQAEQQTDAMPDEQFQQLGYRLTRHNGRQLQLEGPMSNKMDAIRLLVNQPGIADVEIIQPTLDSLYAHFNAAQDNGQEQPVAEEMPS